MLIINQLINLEADMCRKAGRPRKQTQVREKLIFHARELFVVMPYDKVSTRLIAEKANVNVAMIRYYFGSKEGLFEAMIRESIKPIQQNMVKLVNAGGKESLTGLMTLYYKTMINIPLFPKLIARMMSMPESELQRVIVEKVFNDVMKPARDLLFERLSEKGVFRSDLDPELCKMTFFNLMIFPFLAPASILNSHGMELNDSSLNQLLKHNIKVLSQGMISPEQPVLTGENNET